MDFTSLVAANLTRDRGSRTTAAAEERYYRMSALPCPTLGTLVSLATAAGVFLLLTGIAQVGACPGRSPLTLPARGVVA